MSYTHGGREQRWGGAKAGESDKSGRWTVNLASKTHKKTRKKQRKKGRTSGGMGKKVSRYKWKTLNMSVNVE